MDKERTRHYVLKGTKVVPEPDFMKWAMTFERNQSVICQNRYENDVMVSTVFLGLDHDYSYDPNDIEPYQPLVFETMIFGGKNDGFMDRYRTYEDAVKGHHEALNLITEKMISNEV